MSTDNNFYTQQVERIQRQMNGISGEYIMFSPNMAKILGGIKEALFYKNIVFWADKGADTEGWIYKSHKQIEQETYLTRREQGLVRKRLVDKLGVISETLKKVDGKAPTLHFKLNPEGIDNLFGDFYLACTKCTGRVPNVQGACTKCRNPLYTVDNNTVDNQETVAKKSPRKKVVKKKKLITKTDGNILNGLIELFEPVNPAYEVFFRNNTQRKDLDWLCVKYGVEKVTNTINALEEIQGKKYAPSITSPSELKLKLGALIAFTKRQEDEEKEIVGLTDKK